MAFSQGQSFFQDLLNYSDKHSGNSNELQTTFALQARAADFFKNNQFPILDKSQKFSGMMDNNGHKNPLGGPINKLVSGTNNLPGTGICSDEFDFWNENKVPSHKNDNLEKQNDIVERYTNTPTIRENFQENFQENFGGNDTWWIILIIVVILLVLVSGYYMYKR